MEKVLADTSAWIASFSKTGHEELKQVMREKILEEGLFMTGMVLFEILQGVKSEKQFKELHSKLSILPFLSVDDKIWTEVAGLSLSLRSRGVQSTPPDLFIARVAIANDCLLLHCDSDLERIARHTSLKTMTFS